MAVSRKEISIEISLSEICTLQSLLLNFKDDIVSRNYNQSSHCSSATIYLLYTSVPIDLLPVVQ